MKKPAQANLAGIDCVRSCSLLEGYTADAVTFSVKQRNRLKMEVRKDFASAATFLYRIWAIGEEFDRLDNRTWVHLKHEEDFNQVYRLEQPRRRKLESIYARGRGIASDMSSRLKSFNNVGEYPTLTSYVQDLEKSWSAEVTALETEAASFRELAKADDTPWAVGRMIETWDDQLKLLRAVSETANLLKQTEIYKNEHGDFSMTTGRDQAIQVHTITAQGNVLVNSTDNSTNINISNAPVFSSLRATLEGSKIPEAEKSALTQCVTEMEAEVGKAGYLEKYQKFVTAAANHMAVLTPFIPALTSLLSKTTGS